MKQNILVVDDEPGIRLLLTDIFVQEGYNVIIAKTGMEALNKLAEQTVDLIILDYQLPVLDGAGVIRELQQKQSTIPLIIMSGLPELLEESSQTYDSIKEVITKPFNIHDIINLVHSILGKY